MGTLGLVPVGQMPPEIGRVRRDKRRDGDLLADEDSVRVSQRLDETGGNAGVEGEDLRPVTGMTEFLLGDVRQALACPHAVQPDRYRNLRLFGRN